MTPEASFVTDDRTATASVIAHAFSDLGIVSVLGETRGFINFDAELLMSELVELLPPQSTVIELLETIELTPAIVQRCAELRARGFSLALDDIVGLHEAHAAILPLIDVVKIDVQAVPLANLADLLRTIRDQTRVRLLAEKVEDQAMADVCRELGFDLFQGYFFARPTMMSGRRADPAKQVVVRLLQQCLTDQDNAAIASTFKQVPELTYKLMRLVNSIGMGMQAPITSVAHALVVVGRRQLQRWLQVLLFACDGAAGFSSPLLQTAVARGRLLELIAARRSRDQAFADCAFMTGVLSLLDALLEVPMSEAIGQMSLPEDVVAALLDRTGLLGQMLVIAEALEGQDDAYVARLLANDAPCSVAELAELQIAALAWTHMIDQAQG
jgi:EAL and modified HD-GYP domain-containing signal transduction protein